ncbi:amidohydrolase [Tissierella sp. MB52-C2]|uniref:amidohydrolase n=1 Tax=Tissierella sp. MB52-C2 TaxID=3070999 RepID=UPI00280ACD9E|nr:amidohydrolase [Tissierella sp. MB52-C2]WMM23608.1 amidohydrolase [Tissierella sp. MB52-C2]
MGIEKEKIKSRVISAIDDNKDLILEIGRMIYNNPELGFKEFETTKLVKDFFKKELNIDVVENIAYTGCKAEINKDKTGPKVAVLGELDGIVCGNHKDALDSGATHTCGHNIQIAGMLAVAIGLIKSGVYEELDGKIDFIATPAEEFIELDYRSKLKEKGIIKYFGGKQELIRNGTFDDVDISLMFHALDTGDKKVLVGPVSNGFIGKDIRFIGREAHAGNAPHKGVNALNAALLAMNNINAQKETFEDSDKVRIHPIITKGGDIVNVIPADVKMESYTRARTVQAMVDANKKVNRSLIAGAMAVGADIEIKEIPGYLPILKHEKMEDILLKNLLYLGIKEDEIIKGGDFTGSFDLGDVSHIMPTLHPMFGGIKGELHSKDYCIIDEEYIYLEPAKSLALSVVDLLFNDAKEAKNILKDFVPAMTKEEYLNFMDSNDGIIKERFLDK